MEWFTTAGLTNVTTKHVTNPWNAQQYALAICGTKAAGELPSLLALAPIPRSYPSLLALAPSPRS